MARRKGKGWAKFLAVASFIVIVMASFAIFDLIREFFNYLLAMAGVTDPITQNIILVGIAVVILIAGGVGISKALNRLLGR